MALARYQFTVQDEAGNVIPQASISVVREITGNPTVPLYSDRDGATPLGNPFNADSDGFAAFHCVGGSYRVTATLGSFSREWRYVAIGRAQESDSLLTGITWRFSTAITDSDPGAGKLKFNHATLASVTQIFVDNDSDLGATVSTWLDVFDNGGTSADRGTLILQTADASGLLIARITGSVTDGTGYRKLAITPLTTAGAFANDAEVNAIFVRSPVDGITPGLPFSFSSTTSMADPGAGTIRLNNGTLSSVTAAAVDDTSAASGNPDVSAFVLAWDDSTQTSNRGILLIKRQDAPQNFAVYRISGASTDNSGWTQLALTYVAHAGSFSNGDLLSVEFARSADNYTLATASETVEGGVEMATDAEIRSAATGAKAVMAADLETAAANVALTDAATVAIDWDSGVNFSLTVTANRIIGNPTNGQPGTWRTITVQGNDATDRTLTFGNQYLGEVPTITDCDSGRWYDLYIRCLSSSHFSVSSKKVNGT